jgi:hypothetical protein
MRHHSGNEEYPMRSSYALLEDLGDAEDAIDVQKLHVEAIVQHAASLDRIADALFALSDADHGLAFESYSGLKVEAEIKQK